MNVSEYCFFMRVLEKKKRCTEAEITTILLSSLRLRLQSRLDLWLLCFLPLLEPVMLIRLYQIKCLKVICCGDSFSLYDWLDVVTSLMFELSLYREDVRWF